MSESSRLDTAWVMETPEGTQIELRPAGLFSRGAAFVIDELIRWCVLLMGSIAFSALGNFGTGLMLIFTFLVYWWYGVLFEVFNNGVTPGKRSQGLRVVHDDGTPIRFPASMLRNLALVVDILPGTYAAGITSILLTNKFKRIGDIAANTMVVYDKRRADTETLVERSAKPSPIPLRPEEQAAFVEYLERAGTLTEERALELALILQPLLKTSTPEARLEVERIAHGVRGS